MMPDDASCPVAGRTRLLSDREEHILGKIHDLGPDHIFSDDFQDDPSRAAVASLIRLGFIKPHFNVTDEQVERQMRGEVINRDEYDLYFQVTADGRAYYDELIYRPSPIFDRKLMFVTALFCLAVMIGVAFWLI